MCGIAGVVGKLSLDEAHRAVETMLQAQRHRGPDDEGMCAFEAGGTVALGNRRLAILDLSRLGRQPMEDPEAGHVLVYNGELYNFADLRKQLQAEGRTFRGRSDTEVLLAAYGRWGRRCLTRLSGMFAFAVWDKGRGVLLLARDHLGIKPLYYARVPRGGFAFASEVRALMASGLVRWEVDRRALAGFLAYGAVQEPLTIVSGVRMLEPGSWMEVNARGEIVARGRYWEIPEPDGSQRRRPIAELVAEGRVVLRDSVRRHLVSDVPVGVFLSSGLDSTAILGFAAETSTADVVAVTVSFPEDTFHNEAPVARETARRLGTNYQEYVVDSSSALQWSQQALEAMDQPTADGVNTYIVSRAVRQHGVVVALSGQGGDELFGGYRSFRGVWRWLRRMKWLGWMGPASRAWAARLASVGKHAVFRGKAQDVARAGADLRELYFHYRRLCSNEDLRALGLTWSGLGLDSCYQVPEVAANGCLVEGDVTATISRLETVYYLGNTLLRDGDIFSMAHALEMRVPFLDRKVVEWMFRLPGDVLLPPGKADKYLLREMCRDFYSPEQLTRAKRGFSPPFSVWLTGPLRDVMEESVRAVAGSGLVHEEGVRRLRQTFLREPHTAAWSRVWALTVLGHWLTRLRAVSNGGVADFVGRGQGMAARYQLPARSV